ncbi:hypothetical protein SRB5_21600 [Streptomyces sp. RB5]|uniref:AAA family ATPase n=1 Tax=Streptomyces smaragdinus TaxID=2585196 RepID=A0A7K0CEY6_9ACTN|nr:ATP-binding protein [Streptomyces smaragdinus]MQY12031.1 hypothetical protein [Streptomyces smaragdinus]
MDPKNKRQRPDHIGGHSGFTPAFGSPVSGARTAKIVAGDLRLTVNPVDGSQVEPVRPGERAGTPSRLTPGVTIARRAEQSPPVPPGVMTPALPLLEREETRERLVRLLSRGRSVRVTGVSGAGRTTLLNAVAADCADLAPDGVIRLSGRHRTVGDLLYQLYGLVFDAERHRPDRPELLAALAEVGAVVVLDDLEVGGAALDELLVATPECAFLVSAGPDVPAPSPEAQIEEVFLTGLGRRSCLQLLELVVERPLEEDERGWAGDLWFESEGLPLRFVQAGGLLRRRDAARAELLENAEPGADPFETDVPLPTLAQSAAAAPLLAASGTDAARRALIFAATLDGEVPHHAQLPALTEDTHADAAVADLLVCGLVTASGGVYRLASGVAAQLRTAGLLEAAEGETDPVLTLAQHYAWWAGHTSVPAERVAAESGVVLATLGALLAHRDAGYADAAVLLARTAAPAFAVALEWGAWERALRYGQEAARVSGEVAQEAYFHHELGVLALCGGAVDRARTELEASIALRAAIADRGGEIAGRRALALVADIGGFAVPGPDADGGTRSSEDPTVLIGEAPATASSSRTVTATGVPGDDDGPSARRGGRRNLIAAGAGAAVVAVLGVVLTLGAMGDESDGGTKRPDAVEVDPSADEADGTDGIPTDDATTGDPSTKPSESGTPSAPATTPGGSATDGTTPADGGTTGDGSSTTGGGTTTTGGSGTDGGSTSGGPGGTSSSPKPTSKPTTKPTDEPTDPTPTETTPTENPTPPTEDPTTSGTETTGLASQGTEGSTMAGTAADGIS